MVNASYQLVFAAKEMMANVLKLPVTNFFREATALSTVPSGSKGERLASWCESVPSSPVFAALRKENANSTCGAHDASANEENKIALIESAFQMADDPVLKGWKTPYMRRWRKSAVRHCNCPVGG